MQKSTHTPEYRCILKKLVEIRQASGLTQRDLAARLGREHSFVWRIEKGERRLDLLEFRWLCRALNFRADDVYTDLMREMDRMPQNTAKSLKHRIPRRSPQKTTTGKASSKRKPR